MPSTFRVSANDRLLVVMGEVLACRRIIRPGGRLEVLLILCCLGRFVGGVARMAGSYIWGVAVAARMAGSYRSVRAGQERLRGGQRGLRGG